jgi:hypothetical protein
MNMPGFTAEASLCKTSGRYRSARHMTKLAANAIYASAEMMVGEEVVEVKGEAPSVPPPWGAPWGWGPGGWSGGGGAPSPGGEVAWGPPGGTVGGVAKRYSSYFIKNCTVDQAYSDDAKPCRDKIQNDLENKVRTEKVHYIRCVGDKMGCCQNYRDSRGKLRRSCEDLPKKDGDRGSSN